VAIPPDPCGGARGAIFAPSGCVVALVGRRARLVSHAARKSRHGPGADRASNRHESGKWPGRVGAGGSADRRWGLALSEFSAKRGTLEGVEVLVVDDEPSVRQALQRALSFEGYDVLVASDGHAALDTLLTHQPDAILLDVAMPGIDGLEVCRRLRAAGDRTPILMLTARHATADRVAGLDAGADDYLVKPFALEELLARLRALLRRASAPADDDEVLRVADLSLDPATRVVKRGDRLMELTRTEFNLLELLLRNTGQVLTRELIFDRVWGYDFGANSNSLEVYIGYLRRKTEADNEPRLIHTVRGVGYVLRESPTGV
jgi:two-component system response regulator MprA